MEVFFYQAECGDAARIRFNDNSDIPKNILIDSGYERTYDYILKEEIEKIRKNREKIDLCIISHIHSDHIGGVIKYIKEINNELSEDIISNWFYNAPREYKSTQANRKTSVSLATSISQGDELHQYLNSKGKSFKDRLTNNLLEVIDLYGMKIMVLSPTNEKLDLLKQKYISKDTSLERIENETVSDAVSVKGFDYHLKLQDFDLAKWDEDKSIENGSSISIVSELGNKKILWLADSHPTDIVNSMKKMGYSKKKKFSCDLVKVSHHGSSGNNSSELYAFIDCPNYLISSNGENKYYLPTKESLARIILNNNRDYNLKYTIYFTYDNSILRKIFDVDGEDVFKKWNFEIVFNNEKKFRLKI
ncbi:MBL fold metallo-hydrolase [Yeosuana marina]|uniref:MBL fold metallo-hydrolase n=1 Tax=Yeosuana marina TaxID=1565536 RepID=UPI0030C8000B